MISARKRDCISCPSRLESIFDGLNSEHLKDFSAAKITNTYQRGQVMFYEGNQPTGLFCISSGKIKLFKNGTDGNEILLRLVKAGEVIGYRSLLTGENYNATAEVIEDAVVCFVDKTFLNQLIERDPRVALKILKRMGHEMGMSDNRLSDLMNKTVRQRLCHLLLAMGKTYGIKDAEGTLIDVSLTRAELASMVGATPETVIRLLSEFKSSDFVRFRGKRIVVADQSALLREAEIDV
ncbi:MAG: Crp/Fnr family transcriptional regulator [Pseudomonadota bacterium]